MSEQGDLLSRAVERMVASLPDSVWVAARACPAADRPFIIFGAFREAESAKGECERNAKVNELDQILWKVTEKGTHKSQDLMGKRGRVAYYVILLEVR